MTFTAYLTIWQIRSMILRGTCIAHPYEKTENKQAKAYGLAVLCKVRQGCSPCSQPCLTNRPTDTR